MIEELIKRTFATRDMAHLAHWRETSGFRHETLGSFYTDVIEKVDSIVESYQGVFELVEVGQTSVAKFEADMIPRLESDLEWISENRAKITKKLPAIDNQLQDLEGVYMSTLYKLKNLK